MLKLLTLLIVFVSLLQSKELDKVSVQFHWLDQFEFAGYYMAKEKGFYKEVGLDVELKNYQYGMNVTDEVLSRRATYAIGGSDLIVNISNGVDIKLLSATFQSSPLILLATPKSKIKSVKDFKGKRVMLTPDVLSSVTFNAMMKKQGVNISDLVVQTHSFDVNDLINGKTDLMQSYISNEPFALKKQGIKPVIFDPKDYGFDLYSDIVFTSAYEMTHYRQRAIDFNDATIKGWKYAFDNIEETVDVILRKYNSQNRTKEALIYEAIELKKLAYDGNSKLGDINLNKVQRMVDAYNIMNLVNNKVDIKKFILLKSDSDTLSFTTAQKKYLSKKGSIKLCIDPNWMPFVALDNNGNHIGMDADYFNEFSKYLNTSIDVIKTKNWSESLDFVERRKCDIISLAMETQQRRKFLNFTKSYISIPSVLATRTNISFINDLHSLDSTHTIAIPKDYAAVTILRSKYPNLNIVEVDDISDGLNKVRDGKLFGYIGSLPSIAYQFQTQFLSGLKISGKFSEKWELGIGVRSDDKVLLEIFNRTIDAVPENKKSEIFNKHLAIKYEQEADYTKIYQIVVVMIIVTLLILYRQRTLKKHNTQLQKMQKEVQYLNSTLEKRVEEEVAKNREKDKIMFQQSKMASMGEMIANIAHQWRQPLAVINITNAILKEKSNQNTLTQDELNQQVNDIETNILHMSQTIEDFLTYFKPNKIKEDFIVADAFNKSVSILKQQILKKNINISINIDSSIKINGFKEEYTQVILSIITNSIQALSDKSDEKNIYVNAFIDNGRTVLEISDNAGGIPNNIINRIFEPYFTTKHQSQGTGLGLYISKMIIENNMNGTLEVSNIKNGAKFSIKV